MTATVAAPDRANFPCRLCGCTELHLFYTLGNAQQFRYFRCSGCGLANYDLAGGLDQGQYTTIFVDPRDDCWTSAVAMAG